MGLWSISGVDVPSHGTEQQQEAEDETSGLAECVPVIEPVFNFSNLHSQPDTPTPNGERVRSLAYCSHSYVCDQVKGATGVQL